jgi:hypothetical protein
MTYLLLISILSAIPQLNNLPMKTEQNNIQRMNNDIIITNSTSTGISFQYLINDDKISQENIFVSGEKYTVFNIKDAVRREQPGKLDLSSKDVIIAIPQQGDINVTVELAGKTTYENIKIAPVPYQTWEKPAVYKLTQDVKSDIYPEKTCEVQEISYLRNIRIARLRIYPIQYNQVSGQVTVNTDIRITVRFAQPAKDNLHPDYFDGIAKDVILNWEDGIKWKKDPLTINSNSGFSKYPNGFLNWYKIKIESTGVYKMTYDDLNRAGIPIRTVDPRTIRLFNIGECTSNVYYPDTMIEIPIYISGETDSTFDKKDFILFYGLSPSHFNQNRTNFYTNPFTLYNYYWLTWGISSSVSGFGQRIEQISSSQQGTKIYSAENYVHLEQDRDCPARSGLLWIWEFYAKEANVTSKNFDLSLALQNPESLYSIAGRFYASTSSNWMRISLNNTMLDSISFPGYSTNPPAINFQIIKRLLLGQENNIHFTLYNAPEQDVYFDFLNIRYLQNLEFNTNDQALYFYAPPGNNSFSVRKTGSKPIIFDITNYYSLKMYSNYYKNRDTVIFTSSSQDTTFYYISDENKARKVMSIEHKNPGQIQNYSNIKYFIVTSDELYQSSLLLENYRHNNIAGITQAQAKAVPLSEIYDNFTFGIEEPGAIKRLFQKYQPYYGLLLGDGTYDYRNILQLTTFPAVPAYEQGYDIDFQVYSDAALAIDAWYADFDSYGGSPDMMLGRVTARTENEVNHFYQKLVNYETKHAAGFWNKRFIFLADDEYKGQGILDEFRLQHVTNSENVEENLYYNTAGHFRHLEPVKIYLTEYPFSESRDKRKAREALISELDKGASLWCYFGHGSGFQLAHEQALTISYVPLIQSQGRNSIAFFGSCGVGRFEDTKYESIAEELVRKADASIATIGASKATWSDLNREFANIFFYKVVLEPDSTIGKAFIRGQYIDPKYHLFGDPATVPALPNMLGNVVSNPDTLKPGGVINNQAISSKQYFSAAAYSTKWNRFYQNIVWVEHAPGIFVPETLQVNYNLSGYELFRGIGRPVNDSVRFSFTVPVGLPRGIRYDVASGSGYYTEMPNSSRISAIAYTPGQTNLSSYLNDSIAFDTIPATITDFTGPKISFYNGDKRIKPQDKLPLEFTLTGILNDSSGILLCSIPNYNPRLIIKKRPNHTINDAFVTSYFTYDIGNYYQGRFGYPVTLDTGDCVIIIKAADNLRNMSTDSVEVTVLNSQDTIENVLYYSAPNSRTGYFTFGLNQPASVSIKIYTIAGRLIKSIPEQLCNFGYNQIVWNGLDETGILPANGVYLYKVTARFLHNGVQKNKSVVDKFVLMH